MEDDRKFIQDAIVETGFAKILNEMVLYGTRNADFDNIASSRRTRSRKYGECETVLFVGDGCFLVEENGICRARADGEFVAMAWTVWKYKPKTEVRSIEFRINGVNLREVAERELEIISKYFVDSFCESIAGMDAKRSKFRSISRKVKMSKLIKDFESK